MADRDSNSADRHHPASDFEAAVDAIVGGDVATLRSLLQSHPELVRARSRRDHHSTLLHYVAANGVEDIRQKTPANIVEIARLLLDSGADVNAESDAYGGGSTTLGLAATSIHPERAGVQDALMELLLGRGAVIDPPAEGGNRPGAVHACLANGRGAAAEFLAARGARLDLEAAAGVGRIDLVRGFFQPDGSLHTSATWRQLEDGFAWACEFGRTDVVDFLLQKGMEIDARLRPHGQTGLHWAAFGGHAGIVELLLKHGAPIDVKDARYAGTPLDWALYAWAHHPDAPESYYDGVALLVRGGAMLSPDRYDGDPSRRHIAERIRSDPRMQAALGRGRS